MFDKVDRKKESDSNTSSKGKDWEAVTVFVQLSSLDSGHFSFHVGEKSRLENCVLDTLYFILLTPPPN